MANDCTNKLIPVGLKCDPGDVGQQLESAVYGEHAAGSDLVILVEKGRYPVFHFQTKWQPPIDTLVVLSERHEGVLFLLAYSCWESGFRGQTVIRNGAVIEEIRRVGYDGPGYLFADLTHPEVDLFGQYLEPRTLAQHASERLQDAVDIVKKLKETLQGASFTESRYRGYGNPQRVKKTQSQLATMLEDMTECTARIRFDGVLVEEQSDRIESSAVRKKGYIPGK
jgi:hypothetical protein